MNRSQHVFRPSSILVAGLLIAAAGHAAPALGASAFCSGASVSAVPRYEPVVEDGGHLLTVCEGLRHRTALQVRAPRGVIFVATAVWGSRVAVLQRHRRGDRATASVLVRRIGDGHVDERIPSGPWPLAAPVRGRVLLAPHRTVAWIVPTLGGRVLRVRVEGGPVRVLDRDDPTDLSTDGATVFWRAAATQGRLDLPATLDADRCPVRGGFHRTLVTDRLVITTGPILAPDDNTGVFGGEELRGCVKGSGHDLLIGGYRGRTGGHVVLTTAGTYALMRSIDTYSGVNCGREIVAIEVADGQRSASATPRCTSDGGSNPPVHAALAPTGAFAFVDHASDTEDVLRTSQGVVLDQAPAGAITDLRTLGTTLSWTTNGVAHSAPLA